MSQEFILLPLKGPCTTFLASLYHHRESRVAIGVGEGLLIGADEVEAVCLEAEGVPLEGAT